MRRQVRRPRELALTLRNLLPILGLITNTVAYTTPSFTPDIYKSYKFRQFGNRIL